MPWWTALKDLLPFLSTSMGKFEIQSVEWVKGPAPTQEMFGHGYKSSTYTPAGDHSAFMRVTIRQTNPKANVKGMRIRMEVTHRHINVDFNDFITVYEREFPDNSTLIFPMVVGFSAVNEKTYDAAKTMPEGNPVEVKVWGYSKKQPVIHAKYAIFIGASPPHVAPA